MEYDEFKLWADYGLVRRVIDAKGDVPWEIAADLLFNIAHRSEYTGELYEALSKAPPASYCLLPGRRAFIAYQRACFLEVLMFWQRAHWRDEARARRARSMDKADEQGRTLHELVPARTTSPEADLLLHELVAALLTPLSDREREVLLMLGDDDLQVEIAEELGVSESYISQVLKAARRKARAVAEDEP